MAIWDACADPNTRGYEMCLMGLLLALGGALCLLEPLLRKGGAMALVFGLLHSGGCAWSIHHQTLDACSALHGNGALQVEGTVHILEGWGGTCRGETIRVGDLVFYLRNDPYSVTYRRPSCAGGLLRDGAIARVSYCQPLHQKARDLLRIEILHDADHQ